jgi:predicted GIY-YIG superfamily endonuclease
MAKLGNLEIVGQSGTKYSFEVYPYDTSWKEIGAVYLVTKRTAKLDGSGTHTFIYVGQTDNLKERHENHHRADCFTRHGMNCLCVHVEQNEKTRLAIEADLLAAHNWPCNG